MIERLRWIVTFGLIGAFCLVLVPPWKHGGYSLITSPPTVISTIDVSRLSIELVLLAIVCITVAMFAVPAKPAKNGDSVEVSGMSPKRKMLGVCTIFAVIAGVVFGWDAYRKFEASEAVRHEEEELQSQARTREVQAVADYQQEVLTENIQKRNLEERLSKLARPVRRAISNNLGDGVRADFFSYWKDNQMFFTVAITGRPEPLENILASKPSLDFYLLGRDGLPAQTFHVTRSDLQEQRDKHGAVSKMVTSLQSLQCDLDSYEALGQIKLQP
jgi:hypothetical protein